MGELVPYAAGRAAVWHGDCLAILAALPDDSVDSIVTDPPYGLGFMGKQWDSGKSFVERKAAKHNTFDHVGGNHNPANSKDQQRTRLRENTAYGEFMEDWALECLRVLKPGGHLVAFGGTRTFHRLACAVEDAGFEIRDSIAWLYGSGFPKSLDVSKAIDKAAGATREVVGSAVYGDGHVQNSAESIGYHGSDPAADLRLITAPATDDARTWQGWGTALKPAFEPVVVGRKPLIGTVAANVLAHGTGVLNIAATRIEHGADVDLAREQRQTAPTAGMSGLGESGFKADHVQPLYAEGGRWPANVVLDESQAEVLDEQSGTSKSTKGRPRKSVAPGDGWGMTATGAEHSDIGGASRFFYCAKAPAKERPSYLRLDCYCEGPAVVTVPGVRREGETCPECGAGTRKVAHPTVKPLTFMRWLARLVTPPNGLLVDTFGGTGTTGEAALLEGFRVLLVEQDGEHIPLIDTRLSKYGETPEEASA